MAASRITSRDSLIWVCSLLSMLMLTCSRQSDEVGAMQAFRHKMRTDFEQLHALVSPAFDTNAPAQEIDLAIKRFLDNLRQDAAYGCTVAVLDKDMQYIAGRVLEADEPHSETYPSVLDNYRYLKDEFADIDSGRIVHNILYLQNDRLYVIAKAVIKDKRVLGFTFIAFFGNSFRERWGFTDEAFRNIDFNTL